MQPQKNVIIAVGSLVIHASVWAGSVVTNVPGTATPYLAGLPDGTQSSVGIHAPDIAPFQSPVEVAGIGFSPGAALFFSATGLVSHCPSPCALSPPEGGNQVTEHLAGAENGISDIFAPFDALLGVFLGPNAPNLFSSPPPLDFSTLASRDYLSLTPLLQQVFFIGDGRTSTGALQLVVVPEGATRLFLCTMDPFGWANNQGYFSVTVTLTNAPGATLLQIDTYPGIMVWGPIGSKQRVEFATSVPQSNWTPLTNIVLSQSPYFVVDPTPARNNSRFYRAITAP